MSIASSRRARNRPRLFVGIALILVILVAAITVPNAWRWATGAKSVAQRTGVSDQTYHDVLHFREAYAVLRVAADSRWRPGKQLADSVARRFPSEINSAEAPEYLAVMEPADLIDPEVAKRPLESFEPGSDQSAQRVAASSVALSYLYANQSQVRAMFPQLQSEMVGWVSSKQVPLPQLLISAVALENSSVTVFTAGQLARLDHRLHGLRGCEGARTLFSIDGNHSSVCSFTMTAISGALPN